MRDLSDVGACKARSRKRNWGANKGSMKELMGIQKGKEEERGRTCGARSFVVMAMAMAMVMQQKDTEFLDRKSVV